MMCSDKMHWRILHHEHALGKYIGLATFLGQLLVWAFHTQETRHWQTRELFSPAAPLAAGEAHREPAAQAAGGHGADAGAVPFLLPGPQGVRADWSTAHQWNLESSVKHILSRTKCAMPFCYQALKVGAQTARLLDCLNWISKLAIVFVIGTRLFELDRRAYRCTRDRHTNGILKAQSNPSCLARSALCLSAPCVLLFS